MVVINGKYYPDDEYTLNKETFVPPVNRLPSKPADLSDFYVTKKATRPAGPETQCFYCCQPIGECHRKDCVLVKRRVQVRAVCSYSVSVPDHWDKDSVEFHRNESSWCSGNIVQELRSLADELENADEELPGCLCAHIEWEYLGEVDGEGTYLSE